MRGEEEVTEVGPSFSISLQFSTSRTQTPRLSDSRMVSSWQPRVLPRIACHPHEVASCRGVSHSPPPALQEYLRYCTPRSPVHLMLIQLHLEQMHTFKIIRVH